MSKSVICATESSDMDCDNTIHLFEKEGVFLRGIQTGIFSLCTIKTKNKEESRRKNGNPGKNATVKTEESQEETKENDTTLQMRTKAEKAYWEILNILSDLKTVFRNVY